jgi:hypothetical protein
LVIGATIQDGRSLVIDVAQSGDLHSLVGIMNEYTDADLEFADLFADPIDEGFWKYIPEDSTMVLHGTKLNMIYDSLLIAARVSETPNVDETIAMFSEQLETFTTLDLQQDILDWLTGDYAVFFSYDPDSTGLMTAMVDPDAQIADLGVEFGIIIEAVDAEKAQNLVDTLAPLVVVAAGAQEGFSATREEIGGANAVVISMEVPDMNFPLELVIGANDNVLVIGTRNAATNSLAGRNGLNNADRFKDAQRYILDDARSLVYIDQSMVMLFADLVLLGPAIGDVFEEIIAGLNDPTYQAPSEEERAERRRQQLEAAQATRDQVRQVADLFNGIIESAALKDDHLVLRYVLMLSD